MRVRTVSWLCLTLALMASPSGQTKTPLTSADLFKLQSVSDVQLSPDGTHVAYSVTHNELPGRPYSDTWIRELATGRVTKLNGGAGPRWSADSKWVAYVGRIDAGAGLIVSDQNGEGERLIASVEGTNHPLPTSGERLAWSPDGRYIAYVSAAPGPETDNANGDPMVITRYLYKPTAAEGLTRFNDNKRLHLYVVDIATRRVRQLTTGTFYEHSIDWSPRGEEILFVSNRESNPDTTFNYDVFAVRIKDGVTRRLTSTKSAEYSPVWSPDGTRIAFTGTHRDLTSSETTMEDTHVWVMNADGSNRQEIGAGIDNRQGAPQWSPDGKAIYFSVQERGSTKLMRVAAGSQDPPQRVIDERGSLASWSVGRTGSAGATGAAGSTGSTGSTGSHRFDRFDRFDRFRRGGVCVLDSRNARGAPLQEGRRGSRSAHDAERAAAGDENHRGCRIVHLQEF